MKAEIEKIIRKAITRHLVQHVQMPNDTRDRIDILLDEASTEILNLQKKPVGLSHQKRLEILQDAIQNMTPEEKEEFFPEDKTPKGWVSIEDHLPKMLAVDFLTGTTYKVKDKNKNEFTSTVGDHNTWYYTAKEEGITHWWND